MVNAPKNRGTWAETQVAVYLRDHGWPYAERRALAGGEDKGDITGTPGLAWEVKYANSGIKMGSWIVETYVERIHARADHGILVVKPKGRGAVNVGSWVAAMVSWDFEALTAKVNEPVFCTEVSQYVSGPLLEDLDKANKAHPGAVLLRRPPGAKDKPAEWYRITYLDTIAHILRQAGYGTPAPLIEDAHGQAQYISVVG